MRLTCHQTHTSALSGPEGHHSVLVASSPFIFSHSLPHSPSCFLTPAACLLKDFFSCSVALFLSLHLHPHLSCLSFLLLLLLHFVKRLQLNYVSPFSLCNCIFFLLFFLTLGLNTAVRVEYRNLVIVVKE